MTDNSSFLADRCPARRARPPVAIAHCNRIAINLRGPAAPNVARGILIAKHRLIGGTANGHAALRPIDGSLRFTWITYHVVGRITPGQPVDQTPSPYTTTKRDGVTIDALAPAASGIPIGIFIAKHGFGLTAADDLPTGADMHLGPFRTVINCISGSN